LRSGSSHDRNPPALGRKCAIPTGSRIQQPEISHYQCLILSQPNGQTLGISPTGIWIPSSLTTKPLPDLLLLHEQRPSTDFHSEYAPVAFTHPLDWKVSEVADSRSDMAVTPLQGQLTVTITISPSSAMDTPAIVTITYSEDRDGSWLPYELLQTRSILEAHNDIVEKEESNPIDPSKDAHVIASASVERLPDAIQGRRIIWFLPGKGYYLQVDADVGEYPAFDAGVYQVLASLQITQ
jgi:hypothetical protein